MLNEIKIGPRRQDDGSTSEARGGENSEAIVGQAHGKYYEAASRKRIFYAANQAAVTWTAALNTNYQGLIVSNPLMSTVNLSIIRVGFAHSAVPATTATIGIAVGYDALTDVEHDTALVIYNGFIMGPHGEANADIDSDPLPGVIVWLEHFMGAFTAATLFDTTPAIIDVDGAIIVPPGGYVFIASLLVVTGFGSIVWEEVPR